MYQQIHRLDSERWLRAQFPHRAWLLADIDRAITECPAPLDTVGADPRRFGHTVEMAIALDLCTYFPYPRDLEALPADHARFVASTAGYQPPSERAADFAAWSRGRDDTEPEALHTAAGYLACYRAVLYRIGDGSAEASRRLLAKPGHHEWVLSCLAEEAPAFRNFYAAYRGRARDTIRSYGPLQAAPVLPGGRTADHLAGTTIVEVKTGWLDHEHQRHELINQMLRYGLLSQLTPQPATHIAAYLARFDTVLTYQISEFSHRLTNRTVNVIQDAADYYAILETELHGPSAREQPDRRWNRATARSAPLSDHGVPLTGDRPGL